MASEERTLGVIGLGEIGAGVAAGAVRAGIRLVVCDVRPEATEAFADTATVAASPADVGRSCDVVVVAVLDDGQVRSVLEGDRGVFSGARPGTTVVIVSTISLETVRSLADLAANSDVHVLDCGVSGGPSAAAQGALVSMVGGDAAAVDRIRPVLDTFSSLVVHMGPVGSGLAAKLARNLVQYGSWLAAYEGQLLAEAAGIELQALGRVIKASDQWIGGASALMFRTTAAPFGPDDDAGLVSAMARAAGLAHKDLGAALALAEQLGVRLPLASMADARADALFGMAPDGDEKGAT